MEEKLINTLEAGIHSDNDPNAQPQGAAREVWNGTIVSLGSGRFAFESLKGNKLSFQIPDHFGLKPFYPIGWYSFIDFLFVLLGNDQSGTDKPGELVMITFKNDGTMDTYTPIYYHDGLGLTKDHPIAHDQIVGKPENENICRVVWTDDNSSMRTMNIFNPVFTTNIASGSLDNTTPKQYMVLTTDAVSFITYNAVDYGPGRAGGNIFTASVLNTYTTTGTGVKVIEYIPLADFSVIPDFTPGNIFYRKWSTGNLPSACYQYFYQLETTDGFKTNYSYVSLPVHVVSDIRPTNSSQSYAAQINIAAGSNTGKSVILSIDNIDFVTYTKIRVGFIKSTAEGVYDVPKIFLEDGVTSDTFQFTHFGNEPVLETLTLDTITISTSILDLVKSITATKNVLFASNVGLGKDPKLDLSGASITVSEYLVATDLGTSTSLHVSSAAYDIRAIAGHGQIQGEENLTGNDWAYPYQWYQVLSPGGAGSVTYNSTSYAVGKYFRGIPTKRDITNVGDGYAIPVIRIRKYGNNPDLSNDSNYKNIRFGFDFTDYKGIAVSHYLKSYCRRETYRTGFFIYGKKGQQSFVQFLKDKTIPNQWNSATDTDADGNVIGFNMRLSELNTAGDWENQALRIIGLNISGLDFNKIAAAYGVPLNQLDTVVKGFSIVRMPCDKEIINQGVLYPCMIDESDNTQTQVMSFDDIQVDNNYDGGGTNLGRRPNFYMYYSPDAESGYSNSISNIDYVEIADQYSPYEIGADSEGVYAGIGFNCYQKFYAQRANATPVGSNIYAKGGRSGLVPERCLNIGASATTIVVPGLPGLFNNIAFCSASIFSSGTPKHAKCGPGILIGTSASEASFPYGIGRFGAGDFFRSTLNWVRPKSNKYGGNTDAAKATNKYISCGHYQPLDAGFMSYMVGTADATPSVPAQTKLSGIVNNIEVYGGDTFINNFAFGRVNIEPGSEPDTFSNACIIPVESAINEAWRGALVRTFNRNRNYDASINVTGVASSANELFTFYNLYTGKETEYFFPARALNFNGSVRDSHIVMYTPEKVDGEIKDNWRVWPVNNCKRVDGQFGSITNIRGKASRLFYWQQKAVGFMPVYEREMQTSALGTPVQMGVGGILQRFDEVDYWFGNQHQMGLMENSDSFVWFDFDRKTMLRLLFAGGEEPLSIIKGEDSFFENLFIDVESEVGTTIFNSDSPMNGAGIISYYDHRLKMGMMCFKYSKTVAGQLIEKDFTVFFNHLLDKYTGFANFAPNHIISHKGHLLMSRQVRATIIASTAYVVGDEVSDTIDFNNYICILAFTTGGSPIQPSADATHWKKSSQINQVFVNWRGDIGSFFGKVYDSWLSVIMRTPTGDQITIDNIEVNGNNTRFTTVIASTQDEVAQDVNIQTYNKNYRYFDGSWWFTVPLTSANKRLTDSWIQVKLLVKNYVTDPTVSNNLISRIFSIKSSIRKRL